MIGITEHAVLRHRSTGFDDIDGDMSKYPCLLALMMIAVQLVLAYLHKLFHYFRYAWIKIGVLAEKRSFGVTIKNIIIIIHILRLHVDSKHMQKQQQCKKMGNMAEDIFHARQSNDWLFGRNIKHCLLIS